MRSNLLLSALSLVALVATSGCCVTDSRSGNCCSDRCSTGLQGHLFNRGLFNGGACSTCDSGCSGASARGLRGGCMGCNTCASARGGVGLNASGSAYDINGSTAGGSLQNGGLNLPPLRGSLFGGMDGAYADGRGGAYANGRGGAYADGSGIALAGHHDGGCGRMGCGLNGQKCLGCSLRGRRASGGLLGRISPKSQHPYGGHLPHTEPIPSGFGPEGHAPTYQYPYYTTRGPRDFLQANPPSIGY